jgi:hypothetical protein
MAFFKEFHSQGKFEKNFNATFASLIPKKAGAVEMDLWCGFCMIYVVGSNL